MKIEDIELDKGRRYRSVRISGDALISILTTGLFMEIIEGLPQGSQLVGIYIQDYRPDVVDVLVEHPSFDLCPVGSIPPTFTPTGKTYYGLELQVFKRFIDAHKGKSNGTNTGTP